MGRNIEVKARLKDPSRQQQLAKAIATSGPTVLNQHDIFFRVPQGRLKLRASGDGSGELIQYDRPDAAQSKTSQYVVVPTQHPGEMLEALTRALGVSAEVRKTRTLYLAGRTRIHLDNVQGLGQFIELEVVLEEGESEAVGRAEADHLMRQLEIHPEDLISGAYADMLPSQARPPKEVKAGR